MLITVANSTVVKNTEETSGCIILIQENTIYKQLKKFREAGFILGNNRTR
jgi:hypothetical protein